MLALYSSWRRIVFVVQGRPVVISLFAIVCFFLAPFEQCALLVAMLAVQGFLIDSNQLVGCTSQRTMTLSFFAPVARESVRREHTLHVTLLRSRFCDWFPALALGRVGVALAAIAAHVNLVFGWLMSRGTSIGTSKAKIVPTSESL